MTFKIKPVLAILLGLSAFGASHSTFASVSTETPEALYKTQDGAIPVENKEYSVLANPIPNAPTIIEFFSFNCHSCYNYQYVYQIPQKLHAALTAGQNYRYINIDGLLNAGTITHAWALSEHVGKQEEMTNELYYGLQTQKSINGSEDIKKLFMTQLGVSEEEFFKLWETEEVIRHKKEQLALAKQVGVKRTPTFVINGKYQINIQNIEAKTHQEFIEKFLYIAEYLKSK